MRSIEKNHFLEDLPLLHIDVEDLVDAIEQTAREGETVEVTCGETIYEGLEELKQNKHAISAPCKIEIGKIEVDLRRRTGYLSGPATEKVRANSLRTRLLHFRPTHPLRAVYEDWIIADIALYVLLIVLLLIFTTILVPNAILDEYGKYVLGTIVVVAFVAQPFLVKLASPYKGNRIFFRQREKFLRRNSDKIVTAIITALITGALSMLFRK